MSLIEKEYNNVMKKLLTKAYICTYAFKLLKVFMEILIYLKYLCKASSKSGFILFQLFCIICSAPTIMQKYQKVTGFKNQSILMTTDN